MSRAPAPPAMAHVPCPVPDATQKLERSAFQGGYPSDGFRIVPAETPVALVYDGSAQAVMMATPYDLLDFAVGFSLTEGIVATPGDIRSLDIITTVDGIEVQMWLAEGRGATLAARRRHLAGPTGCGLCGIDSLTEAVRPTRVVDNDLRILAGTLSQAMDTLPGGQVLNRVTQAVHAAALWTEAKGCVLVREDVGRHNALDKLVGAVAQAGLSAADGVLLLTSRVSVEMVQKAAVLGAPIMLAVSAPTALAVRTADAAGITLAAVARGDSFEVFTHPQRILPGARPSIAPAPLPS